MFFVWMPPWMSALRIASVAYHPASSRVSLLEHLLEWLVLYILQLDYDMWGCGLAKK
jgi:hypothetical protein